MKKTPTDNNQSGVYLEFKSPPFHMNPLDINPVDTFRCWNASADEFRNSEHYQVDLAQQRKQVEKWKTERELDHHFFEVPIAPACTQAFAFALARQILVTKSGPIFKLLDHQVKHTHRDRQADLIDWVSTRTVAFIETHKTTETHDKRLGELKDWLYTHQHLRKDAPSFYPDANNAEPESHTPFTLPLGKSLSHHNSPKALQKLLRITLRPKGNEKNLMSEPDFRQLSQLFEVRGNKIQIPQLETQLTKPEALILMRCLFIQFYAQHSAPRGQKITQEEFAEIYFLIFPRLFQGSDHKNQIRMARKYMEQLPSNQKGMNQGRSSPVTGRIIECWETIKKQNKTTNKAEE